MKILKSWEVRSRRENIRRQSIPRAGNEFVGEVGHSMFFRLYINATSLLSPFSAVSRRGIWKKVLEHTCRENICKKRDRWTIDQRWDREKNYRLLHSERSLQYRVKWSTPKVRRILEAGSDLEDTQCMRIWLRKVSLNMK